MWVAQHLIEDVPELTSTKTKLYPAEWSSSSESEGISEQLPRVVISIPNQISVLFCVQIVEVRLKLSQSFNLLLLEEQPAQLH